MMCGYAKKLCFVILTVFQMLCLICIDSAFSATPVINEIMPSNILTVKDEDRDNSDWIEIYNPGNDIIDLHGYTLSDNEYDPAKWTFPHITISPHGHLLVFASGKNRVTNPSHWETVINKGDIWRYFTGKEAPPENWREQRFNDDNWNSGASQFGYGYNTVATVVPKTITLFIRKTFTVSSLSHITDVFFHVDYNDGFVAYLNGVEIARSNVSGFADEHPPYNQKSIYYKDPLMNWGLPPEGYRLDNIKSLLVNGENVLAIQVHNNKEDSDNLFIDPYLTLGMDSVPTNPSGVAENLKFTPPCLHTNFKLDASGETLTLSSDTGTVCDQFSYELLPVDNSQERYPDGGSMMVVSNAPTPGTTNREGFTENAGTANTEPAGGFYTGPVTVTVSTDSPVEEIHYTLSGDDPDMSSAYYSGPITLSETAIFKARAFHSNRLPGPITTRTYFVGAEHSLPVISISTPPDNLWDTDTGIYCSPNYWNEWERPAHIEFYETDGSLLFSEDAGISIKGGLGSRYWPQKSLAVSFRNSYGVEKINCRLFPDSDVEEYQSFVLRNAGNDFEFTHIRDGMIQTLVKDIDIDQQNFRPALVYINGSYWGIQGIREKQNEDYLATHHNADPDNVDMLELNAKVIEGEAGDYERLYNYIESHDLSKAENYEYVEKQMDIDEFISYNAIQIFCDNQDWPGNNIKYWREKEDGSKWRWMLFDTDFGFGLKSSSAYTYNTLDHAMTVNGLEWRNPAWSTMILRKLLGNDGFRNKFINCMMDYLSTLFSSETVLSIIADIEGNIETEMPAHIETWGYPESMEKWHDNMEVLKVFAEKRPEYLITFIEDKFDTGSRAEFSIDVSGSEMGSIRINSMVLDEFPWEGMYFTNIPVTLIAIPKAGYRFVGWEGAVNDDSITIRISGNTDVSLKAIFEEGDVPNSEIIINEVNYQSQNDFDTGDWIELFNNSNQTINLGHWVMKDSQDDNEFTIQYGTELLPKEYLILCADSLKFKQIYPSVTNRQGDFDFGLNKNGDAVRLYDQYGTLVDSLTYNNRSPWPKLDDDAARTISLSNPARDNSQGANWSPSKLQGTPGSINDNYITIDEETGKEFRAFILRQNYPNPFNQTTTITFELPRDAYITIDLYTVLGQKIKTLTRKHYTGGKHNLTVDLNDLPSGIYLYKMSTGSFNKTKRLLLIK